MHPHPYRSLCSYFSIFLPFRPDFSWVASQFLCQQVIWPSPGTLVDSLIITHKSFVKYSFEMRIFVTLCLNQKCMIFLPHAANEQLDCGTVLIGEESAPPLSVSVSPYPAAPNFSSCSCFPLTISLFLFLLIALVLSYIANTIQNRIKTTAELCCFV